MVDPLKEAYKTARTSIGVVMCATLEILRQKDVLDYGECIDIIDSLVTSEISNGEDAARAAYKALGGTSW